MKLISACLAGINCRYDGKNALNERVLELFASETLIPVCPEQLGGLGTPREPMQVTDGGGSDVFEGGAKVMTDAGDDVTESLIRGAKETLKIAKLFGVREAIMKADSPSCGCGKVSDGVTTALLKRNGIWVITEEEL